MRILHTLHGFGINSGGVSTCTYDLLKGLNKIDCFTDALTLDSNDPTDRLIGDESWVKFQPYDAMTPYGISSNIKKYLYDENEYDLYHTNGLWLYCNHITSSIARKKCKPYIISTHGMLYPHALKCSAWKKNIMRKLYFDRDLSMANCIHTTCKEEMYYYRKLKFDNPVAVIPNPISIVTPFNTHSKGTIFRLGFLGRIHPIKRIEQIIYAWSNLNNLVEDSELLIMGKGDKSYMNFLGKEIKRLNLHNVLFLDFVSGHEKYEKLASLSCLCLPSESENFGMVVTEALSVGIPVIASKGTPWEELNKYHCGWWVDNDVETLSSTIQEVLNTSEEERIAMGERGKQLIKNNYSVEIVADKMKRLYEWVLYGGEKPEFVYLK